MWLLYETEQSTSRRFLKLTTDTAKILSLSVVAFSLNVNKLSSQFLKRHLSVHQVLSDVTVNIHNSLILVPNGEMHILLYLRLEHTVKLRCLYIYI